MLSYYGTAETFDEEGYYVVNITTDKCSVSLMPDMDYGRMTVIVSDRK